MPASKTLSDVEIACIKTDDFSSLQFGFEQETQSVGGCTIDNVHSMISYWEYNSKIDVTKLNEAKKQAIVVFLNDHEKFMRLWSYHGAYFSAAREMFLDKRTDLAELIPFEFAILEYYKTKNISFDDVMNSDGSNPLGVIQRQLSKDKVTGAQILESVRQNESVYNHIRLLAEEQAVKDVRTSNYRVPELISDPTFPFVALKREDFIKNLFPKLSPLIEAVGDGSVSGFELKPIRPLTFEETQVATDSLFQIPMHVDTRCSFHVHVSVKNNNSAQYDEKLQMYMCEYIVANLDKVPDSCLERWRNTNQLNRYFAFQHGSQKYTFVSFCSKFKTWEFRCFGNIQDQEDAMMCIKIAGLAYKYALRRKNRDAKAMLAPSAAKSFLILKKTLTACLEDTTRIPKEVFTEIAAQDKASRIGRYSKNELTHLNRHVRTNETYESRFEVSEEQASAAVKRILSRRTA